MKQPHDPRASNRPSVSDIPAGQPFRPDDGLGGGWLRATRQSLGLTLRTVAGNLRVSPQAVHQFEKSEAAGTISLRQLQNVARAMGCQIEYRVVGPKFGNRLQPPTPVLGPPEAKPPPLPVEARPAALEHSLLLENQAAGRFD
jgi:transcriptional regulator with XRE-family HTH domain